jgi:hypothetical protein
MTTKYHPVKDINKKKEIWRLAVILDDIWSVHKGDIEDHLELLIRDVNVRYFMDVSENFSIYQLITLLHFFPYIISCSFVCFKRTRKFFITILYI